MIFWNFGGQNHDFWLLWAPGGPFWAPLGHFGCPGCHFKKKNAKSENEDPPRTPSKWSQRRTFCSVVFYVFLNALFFCIFAILGARKLHLRCYFDSFLGALDIGKNSQNCDTVRFFEGLAPSRWSLFVCLARECVSMTSFCRFSRF